MKITVHDIGSYAFRNYLLDTPQGVIAIDTGYPGGAEHFISRFKKLWPLSRLRYIFLSHHHDDHAGFLKDLLQTTDAQVVLHPLANAHLQAGCNSDMPGGGYSSWPASLFGLMKKGFSFPPVTLGERSVFLKGEEDQPFQALGLPIQVLFLPGHTPDSLGLFLPETGQLFCADAAMNAVISVARHTIWIDDALEFGRSWDKMLALRPTKIYPSHGNPFSPKDLLKYRNYLNGKCLIPPR